MYGIKYVSPVLDNSGYAAASRNYILSLHRAGIPIMVTPHCFEAGQMPVGSAEDRNVITSLTKHTIDYDFVICQLTPDIALTHREPGKYNIAYFAWETSRVHHKWVECLNQMDEAWVPSEWNVETLKESGVTVPVRKIPHGINPLLFDKVDLDVLPELNLQPSTFKFYSIFQWQPRKNPESLIRSYINAFSPEEDVVLLIKTYIKNGATQERQFIRDNIMKIKMDMGVKAAPKMLLLLDMMSDDQIVALHKKMDCLVYLTHGEGWGLTPFEAGLAENPVIATGMGGHSEFMNGENSYPVDYQLSYVKGMSVFNPWYLGSGLWADPDEVHASTLMRRVFENRTEAKNRGKILSASIKSKFSWRQVSDMMISRLNEISGSRNAQ